MILAMVEELAGRSGDPAAALGRAIPSLAEFIDV